MTPTTPGSELGKQVISPFKSSGRVRVLTEDRNYYLANKNIHSFPNVGPGKYNYDDNWTKFERYNKKNTFKTKIYNKNSSNNNSSQESFIKRNMSRNDSNFTIEKELNDIKNLDFIFNIEETDDDLSLSTTHSVK
jgi:hypothetical protein